MSSCPSIEGPRMQKNRNYRPFPLGQIVATPDALETVAPERVFECLSRHAQGDWGDVCAEDAAENDLSSCDGFRILSVYPIVESDPNSEKFWIITEADRSSTCVLLPSNY
jgi:hypothetical protein